MVMLKRLVLIGVPRRGIRRLALLLVTVLAACAVAAGGVSAAQTGPYVVVEIVSFIGPDCSAAVVDITNQGDAEQPFGWTLTLDVAKLKISATYFGQQPLAAGETRESIVGTDITTPGTYHVTISPGEVSGKAKSGSAILRLPATC
jgi:hypothetical protein